MSDSQAISNEDGVRLRASCNACYQSKLRCSQRKPTCERCERNEIESIYGLSRRTHKDAPRISALPLQRRRKQYLRSVEHARLPTKGDTGTIVSTPSSSTNNFTICSPNGSAEAYENDILNAFDRHRFPMPAGIDTLGLDFDSLDTSSTIMPSDHLYETGKTHVQLPSSADIRTSSSTKSNNPSNTFVSILDEPSEAYSNSNGSYCGGHMSPIKAGSKTPRLFSNSLPARCASNSTIAPDPCPMLNADHAADPPLGDFEWLFGANYLDDMVDEQRCSPRHGESECSCHEGVTDMLALMRNGGGDGGSSSSSNNQLSLDARLALLKQCIITSETSIRCSHTSEDSEPIHIMTVALLIGHVIDAFTMLAKMFSPQRPSSNEMTSSADDVSRKRNGSRMGTNLSSGSMSAAEGEYMEPRISWGVLAIEEEDEKDLRRMLYLRTFRKVEKLLSQLALYLRGKQHTDADSSNPSRHVAFMNACNHTYLWLNNKAMSSKLLLSVPSRIEC